MLIVLAGPWYCIYVLPEETHTPVNFIVNLENCSGYFMYHHFQPSAYTVYLWGLCGSENKLRLFPYTALID
jgi:hypothetical protein